MNYHPRIQFVITIAVVFIIIGATFIVTKKRCQSTQQKIDEKGCAALSSIESMIFGEDTTDTDTETDTRTIDDSLMWDLSDLSSWNMENIEDLGRTIIDMQTLGVLQSSKNGRSDAATVDGEEIEDDTKVEFGTTTSRRLRLQESGESTSNNHPLEKQQRQEKRWAEDAEGMQSEFMQYFLEERGNKKQRKEQQKMKMGRAIEPDQKANVDNEVKQRSGTIIDRQHNTPVVDTTQRNVQEYTHDNPFSLNCTDPNANLECPPEDLPQVCDRYNGGTIEECYQRCKISFCCIHDSKSVVLAPSCSKELNCKNWHPCYIVWWKLHDTIGPESFVRLAQNESFYNIDFSYVQNDFTTDEGDVIPFYGQWFFHHFDDDNYKPDTFVEDPDNW